MNSSVNVRELNGSTLATENGFKEVKDTYMHLGSNGCIGSSKNPHYATAPDTDQAKLDAVEQSVAYLMSQTRHRPQIAIICGTGLGGIADKITEADSIPYTQIPNFKAPGVVGHAGRLVFGKLGGKSVVCMVGRNHFYEGHSMWQITYPVRVFHALGIRIMVVTNASGSLNPDYKPGDIMVIKDHINLPGLAGFNPILGLSNERFGVRFPPMNDAYDWKLRSLLRATAAELGLRGIREGVYVCQSGPSYETVAEIKMLRIMGGDSVGMSTAHEVTVARHGQRPIRCVGLSLVTNYGIDRYPDDMFNGVNGNGDHVNGCNGKSVDCTPFMDHPDHSAILQTAERRSADLQQLVGTFLSKIDLTTVDD